MNWGKGLVLGLAAFMLFISALVVQMFKTAEDGFDKDYYEKGLAYDVDYQQKQQVITDKVQPQISQTDDAVKISFAVADSGTVQFKRPSNQSKDQFYTFKSNQVNISKADFEKGEWKLIIRWSANQKQYLFDANLFMP